MRFSSNCLRILGAALLVGASAVSQAQTWPVRPVRLVVPFPLPYDSIKAFTPIAHLADAASVGSMSRAVACAHWPSLETSVPRWRTNCRPLPRQSSRFLFSDLVRTLCTARHEA